jgi:dolichol kinase
MISELPLVILIAAVVAIGLFVANITFDLGVPHSVSRKIGHGAGGVAFLVSSFLSSVWWPLIVSAMFGAFLLFARLLKPEMVRGVGGTGRDTRVLAEVWFAWVAVPVYGIAWLWLDKPGVAVACLLFMAWGDGVTGLVRWQVYRKPVKGLWGSVAMICACLVISWAFISPLWIGAVASLAATVTEWAFGDNGKIKWADDNWAVPLVSLGVILGLMALTGAI